MKPINIKLPVNMVSRLELIRSKTKLKYRTLSHFVLVSILDLIEREEKILKKG